MNNTKRTIGSGFKIPEDVVDTAALLTASGIRITVTPAEIMNRLMELDGAINVRDDDLRYEALCQLRDWISDIYEEPERRLRS